MSQDAIFSMYGKKSLGIMLCDQKNIFLGIS